MPTICSAILILRSHVTASKVSGDWNRDSRPDLAVLNRDSATVTLLFGTGNGTFVKNGGFVAGATPSALATADFNRDGLADLLVTSYAAGTASVYPGQGNGTFAPGWTASIGASPTDVSIGDFDRDGRIDAVVIHGANLSLSILRNSSGE